MQRNEFNPFLFLLNFIDLHLSKSLDRRIQNLIKAKKKNWVLPKKNMSWIYQVRNRKIRFNLSKI